MVVLVRCLITGVDASGRSCVAREREVAFAELVEGLHVDALFRTTSGPPGPRPHGRGALVDLGVGPGQCSVAVWRFDPDSAVEVHHTDSLDVDVVVEGSIDLVLDDGPHPLGPGDSVVVTGVDHAWRAGPDGCVLVATNVGTARREPPEARASTTSAG